MLINGTPCVNTVYGKDAILVGEESKEEITKGGGSCYCTSDIVLAHFKEVAINNAALLTHKQALKAIMENMKTRYPIIVEELIPHKINYDMLHKIIVSLINKGHSIRDMLTICEVINDCIDTTDDIQTIISQIEKAIY